MPGVCQYVDTLMQEAAEDMRQYVDTFTTTGTEKKYTKNMTHLFCGAEDPAQICAKYMTHLLCAVGVTEL